MSKFETTNGVEVLFDNNDLYRRDGDDPFLAFDDDKNLVAINFNGYVIKPKEDEDS